MTSTTLAIIGILSVVGVLFLASHAPQLTGEIVKYRMLSERLCPPGTVSVYRGSPALYPGGPAEQLNVVCVTNRRPIEAEGNYFEHEPVYPFDRLRQDKLTRHYD